MNQPSVILSQNLIQITEGGTTTTYTARLNRAPSANVTLTLNAGNQLSVDQTTLTFTPANWNVDQTISVTAVDDTIGEGPHRGTITTTVSSTDANYNGLTVPSVVAQITDNDLSVKDPTFQVPRTNPFGLTNPGIYTVPAFVDIDADGDLDAFVSNSQGNTLFYLNTGSTSAAAFAAPSTNPFGLTHVGSFATPTFVDIDGDGDLDAFVGERFGSTLFYHNTGSTTAPTFAAPSTNPFGLTDVGYSAAPTFVDIDGDGDLDAFVGESDETDGSLLFYRNTGSVSAPAFAAPSTNPFGLTNLGTYVASTFVDIDADGDLDAFVGNHDGNTLFYRNTGSVSSPTFVFQSTNPFGLTDVGFYAKTTLVDIDSDGDLDAFVGNSVGNIQFFLNQPGVTLSPSLIQVTEGGTTATYTVKLASAPSANVTLTLNAGSQLSIDQTTLTFTPANWNVDQTITVTAVDDTIGEGPHGGTITTTVSSTDANYNGLTVASVVAQITDNDLPVTDPTLQAPSTNPFGLTNVVLYAAPTFVDIDADGDLDAFVGNNAGDTLFYQNTGSVSAPAFATPSNTPFGLTNVGISAAPAFVDIDGDGDLDAFVSNEAGDTLFYRNTGSATVPAFAAPSTNPFGLSDVGGYGIPTLVDIDGDGDLDAFVGNNAGDTLFYQNTGSVSAPAFAAPSTNPFGLSDVGTYAAPTLVDIDGDGDLDALLGDQSGNTLLYLNTGSVSAPAFATPSTNPFGLTDAGDYVRPTFVDLDGDSDLDAFVGNKNGDMLFFLNQQNQVPTAVTLDNQVTTIAENSDTTTRIKVADITITDDALGTETIVLSGADASSFEVEGSVLYLKAGTTLDFETKTSYAVTVEVDDNTVGATPDVTANFTLSVTDVDETIPNAAPTIVSPTDFDVEVAENSTTVILDLEVDDPENQAITFALVGVDAALFTLSNQGVLTFNQAPNFELPADQGGDNVYTLEVQVSDGTNTVNQAVTVTVSDVNEAPTLNLVNPVTTLGQETDTSTRIKVADISISNDALGSNTTSLSGADADLFEIVGTELYLKAGTVLDFQTNPQLDVLIAVDDASVGNTPDSTAALTIAVEGEVALIPEGEVVDAELNTVELVFDPTGNGNVNLDSDRASASTEVQNVRNGTEAVFDNLIGLYEVVNPQGGIDLDGNGSVDLNPGDTGYALAALTSPARVENFTLRAGASLTTAQRVGQTGDVLLEGGKFYSPFVIANGGAIGVEGFITAEKAETDGIFNDAAKTVTDLVAYFSFVVANPDGVAHLRSYGNGVFGFEDLPSNLPGISDKDFNDAVFAFNFTAAV